MIDEDFIKAFKESEKFKDFVFEKWYNDELRCVRKDWAIVIDKLFIQFIRRNGSATFVTADSIEISGNLIKLFCKDGSDLFIGQFTLEELA